MVQRRSLRSIGIDPGERRVGIAVSDSSGSVATPLMTLHRNRHSGDAGDDLYQKIVDLALEYRATCIVVGLPVNMDGSEGAAAESARREADLLAKLCSSHDIDVVLVDERLSSTSSLKSLNSAGTSGRKKKKVIDQVAASVLLQSWLDSVRNG